MRFFAYFTRYFIIHLLGPFALITLTLTGIIWLIKTLSLFERIIDNGINVSTLLYFSSLLLPSLLIMILPVALFCAILYCYNRFIMESELIIWRSVGLSDITLARPVAILALLVTLISYGLTFYGLPVSYQAYKELQYFIKEHYISVGVQEGVFNKPIKNITVYVDERSEDNMLKGILVHDTRDKDKPITMMAEKGTFILTDSGPFFMLFQGNRQEKNATTQQLSILYFERYAIDLTQYHDSHKRHHKEPEELFISELWSHSVGNLPYQHKLQAELHKRLVIPLYNAALASIALVGLLKGSFNRRGQTLRLIMTSSAAFFVMVTGFILQHMIQKYPFLIYILYIHILGSIAFSVGMLWPLKMKKEGS